MIVYSNAKDIVEESIRQLKWENQSAMLDVRDEALDYYTFNNTAKYIDQYFAGSLQQEIPIYNVNLTKKLINRISLVYKDAPIRDVENDSYYELTQDKDWRMKSFERIHNLLGTVAIHIAWEDGKFKYNPVMNFVPIMDPYDPLKPIGVTYPLNKATGDWRQTKEDIFVYWSAEEHYMFDSAGSIIKVNEDNINPYGVLPFVECFKDGRPEYSYLDTSPANDIIATNLEVNVSETNSNANTMFQSFGYMYVNGSQVEKDTLEVGQDKISFLGIDGTMNIVSPPNTVDALASSVEHSYKLLAQNYHLNISFVDGTAAQSGVAIRLRNQELQDARLSDVIRWKGIENKLFDLESIILGVEAGINTGTIEKIDYGESIEVLSYKEQIEKWTWELANKLIDEADILMQQDPDRYPDRETAKEYLAERSGIVETEEGESGDTLLAALTKPVE